MGSAERYAPRLNLAAALAERHEVEIVSMMRHRGKPRFTLDPRVRLVPLVDTRPGGLDARDPLFAEPTRDFPVHEKRNHQYNRLMDVRVARYLEGCRRRRDHRHPAGHQCLPRPLRPAQGAAHRAGASAVRGAQQAAAGRAGAALPRRWTPSSPRRRRTRRCTGRRCRCRGRGPRDTQQRPRARVAPPSEGTAPVIAAAGRLVRGKRFDLLIDAFAEVCRQASGLAAADLRRRRPEGPAPGAASRSSG